MKATEDMISFISKDVDDDYNKMAEMGEAYYNDASAFRDQMRDFLSMAQNLSHSMMMVEDNISQIMSVIEEQTASITMLGESSVIINDKTKLVNDNLDTNEDIVKELGGVVGKFKL